MVRFVHNVNILHLFPIEKEEGPPKDFFYELEVSLKCNSIILLKLRPFLRLWNLVKYTIILAHKQIDLKFQCLTFKHIFLCRNFSLCPKSAPIQEFPQICFSSTIRLDTTAASDQTFICSMVLHQFLQLEIWWVVNYCVHRTKVFQVGLGKFITVQQNRIFFN